MKVLLIPSATLIPKEMRSQMGAIPVCLFPLHNVTMLERICARYRGAIDRAYVVARKEKEKIKNYIALKRLDVRVIELEDLHDLGYTIWQGLNAILAECGNIEQVYINFGDTLLANAPNLSRQDIIYYARETFTSDWTYFEHENGVIHNVIDKGQASARGERFGNVFPGVFEFSHPQKWIGELSAALNAPSGQVDSFYQALMGYSQAHPFELIPAEDWFDVGHRDRYAQAKSMVASRAFNTIEIDKDRGLLTKRSENRDKLLNEIKWYLKLPDQLQYLLPRIYRYSLDWDNPYVTMEYYGYTTLHEMLVYGDVSEAQWRKIFARLRFILRDMQRFVVIDSSADMRQALEEIYVNKTVSRLEQLRKNGRFSAFFENPIIINERVYPSLNSCIRWLPSLVRKKLMNCAPRFCIIHGDLCFSNILVESDLGFLRVIDPRGSFGRYDIYGDPRYELAKLMHSMEGQYDLIIEDMFTVQAEGSRIELKMPENIDPIYMVFKDVFCDLMTDESQLRLIEGLLFLSMLPLHSDKLNRQYAMLAAGLELVDKAIGGKWDGDRQADLCV